MQSIATAVLCYSFTLHIFTTMLSKNGKALKRYACHYADYTVNARNHAQAVALFRSRCSGILTSDVYLDGPDIIIVHNDSPLPSPVDSDTHSITSSCQGILSFPE